MMDTYDHELELNGVTLKLGSHEACMEKKYESVCTRTAEVCRALSVVVVVDAVKWSGAED